MKIDRREFVHSSVVSSIAVALCHGTGAGIREESGLVKPRRFKPGDTVALINPAGATARRVEIEIVQESLEALELEVKLADHLLDRYGYLAGADENRAADVNAQFNDSSVAGILAVRGGWGCARILPLIDYAAIQRNPKIIIGYSDVTALLLAIYARTGMVTFHGPVGISPWNSFTVDYFRKILWEAEAVEMRNPDYVGDNLTQVSNRVQTIVAGKASGRLLGGNLAVLSAIVGSDYLPDWDGSILFVEDINENIYRIDRMLTQLKLAGILDRISGFVFGKCTDCDPGQGYGSLTIDQVLDDHIKPLGVPAWQGAMIGHTAQKFTVPVGIDAEIDADEGTIRLLEPAVG
jgi:muramoyltetrapeptide carboxypeptidase